MLGLTILSLEINVNTTQGVFSATFTFDEGLNIIRAENSSGKSTTVNAIAYALGLEAILGPSGKKRVFPKSMYEEIFRTKQEGKDGIKPYFVNGSHVKLLIKNSNKKKASLHRDILGFEEKITVSDQTGSHDYFLGTGAAGVGSAKSEKGFHHWLAEFIGWDLPDVIKFDGGISKLYLECIFPLFFIEQKRGWSEIQANMPSYGIQNAKRVAIEFCLAIHSFEHDNKIAGLKNTIEETETEWRQLVSQAEGIADFNHVRVNNPETISEIKEDQYFQFTYLQGNRLLPLESHQRALEKEFQKVSDLPLDASEQNQALDSQRLTVRTLDKELDSISNSIEANLASISEIDEKIEIIEHDYEEYQQLIRLQKVGADLSEDLELKHCPLCQSELFDTLAVASKSNNKPMSLFENTEFLKNQLDFYKSVRSRTANILEGLIKDKNILQKDFDDETQKLNRILEQRMEPNSEFMEQLRAKIDLEIKINEVKKLKKNLNDLNAQAERIYSVWKLAKDSLDLSSKSDMLEKRKTRLKSLEAELKTYLAAFGFNSSSIGSISISNQTLRPEQEGYNIVAETSASDYIRIIWSYTLALMHLASKYDDMHHGGFVVFDEPRQHEASKSSFAAFIKKAAEAKEFGGQVIFATSIDKDELHKACKDLEIKDYYFDDYVFSLNDADS